MRSVVTAVAACSLLTLAALPAAADAQLQFTGIGGHIGLVSPENLDSTFGLGVHADLGSLSDNVRLEGNLDYWKSSLKIWEDSWSYRDISLGGTAKYHFGDPSASFQPYTGGGLVMHLLKADTTIGSLSTSKIGLDLVAGGTFGSSGARKFFAEARYRMVDGFAQFCIGGGITHYLGE